MKIELGGLNVVIETYIGHTDTDLIVRVPDRNIVFTGDLLVNSQYMTNINGYPTPGAPPRRSSRNSTRARFLSRATANSAARKS